MFIIASPGVTDVVDFRLVSTPDATINPVGEGLDDVVLDTGLMRVSSVSTAANISSKHSTKLTGCPPQHSRSTSIRCH